DEADEMLHMGFAEDVEKIASYVPPQRITALFSATMPARIRKIADQHLHEPIEIEVALPATTASTISQYVTQVIPAYKTLALTRIINAHSDGAILVFVRTRATAESLMLELTKRGIAGRVLSGDVPQNEREKIIERLKEGVLHVLVATDVAARGLDVERISLVINYDIPRDVDSYVHRIGRTGRAGRTGTALSIISPKEKHLVRSIQERTGAEITYIDVPSQAEIRKQKAQDLLTQALDELDEKTLYSYQEIVSSYLHTSIGAHPSPSDLHDIIVRLTALSLKNYDIYDDGPEHLPSKAEKSTSKKKRGKKTDKNALPYRIEVGHKDKVRPGAIVGALTHEGGLLGENIGNINIHPTFTIVDLYQPLSAGEKKKIGRIEVAGRKLSIREDTGPKKKSRKKKRKK
ncbi:MAG: DEAD/DEAH box helicase, partial [Actinomycetaceae bacterium]|nr:DEAD/DEAH box helicase [Actinomycetaceae bacterium]